MMKEERKRGTMLVSSAVILCCVAFAAGFVSGSLVAEHRGSGSLPVGRMSEPAASSSRNSSDGHIADLRSKAMNEPENAELWTQLGNACFDAGDAEGAIEAYLVSLRLVPGNADVRTDMGSMYRMKGQPRQAVECYEQALRDHPGHKNAIFNKGVTLLLDLEQPEQAMEFWQAVLAGQPGFTLSNGALLRQVMPELTVDAALQLEARGRVNVALRAYAEALKLDADFMPALVHRAWLLEHMGREEEALPLWMKVLEAHPDATDPSGARVSNRIGR